MLRHLRIVNFAIIKEVNLDFSKGMTVLSGETGAGKSIIIDALSLILGARGSTDFIRFGEDKFTIEGLFQFDEVPSDLQHALIDSGLNIDIMMDDLIISREINSSGKNLIKINGQLANVSTLKVIGSYLGDIHGQNEHQQLLDAKQHRLLLDSYGDEDHQGLLKSYRERFDQYRQQRQHWFQACQTDHNLQQRLNFLTFQVEELQSLNLNVEEEAQLTQQSKYIQNYQVTQGNLQSVQNHLSDGEANVLSMIDVSLDKLQEIVENFDQANEWIDRLTSARYDIEDIAHQISRFATDDELDIDDLDHIEERLANLASIKRKYGMTVEELIVYQESMTTEIDQIIHRESYLNQLQKDLIISYEETMTLARQLSQRRKDLAKKLSLAIESQLSDLYMKHSRFEVMFDEVSVDTTLSESLDVMDQPMKLEFYGMDVIEFYVTTNVGDNLNPLVKVASGGELSRLMLALKAVFSKNLPEKVMVFDEIDTGVSGRVGYAIAKKMYTVAQQHQVLAITHLPPVAAISDHQLYIEKIVQHNETETQVRALDLQERYRAIASMLSSETNNDHAIAVVKDMMSDLKL